MIILTSPAKTLDFISPYKAPLTTEPLFLDQSVEIMNVLKKKSVKQLEKKLHVSKHIAELNYQRFQQWERSHTLKNSRESIFAYHGDIYRPLSPTTYTLRQAEYIQHSLRIISGLYGLVRPYDLIQPYRLEMNAPFKINKKSNLYSFWQKSLTIFLNEDIKKNNAQYVINLASSEYFKAINFDKLIVPVITIEFRQKTKDGLKNVGILSKRARGEMIEFMTKNTISTLEKMKDFNTEGYAFYKDTSASMWFVK